MANINIVVADFDDWYIESLSNFIRNKYLNKFNVNVFTRENSLVSFLDNNSEWVDILLIVPDMLSDKVRQKNARLTVLLSEGEETYCPAGFANINKYQPGEIILNNIIELFSSVNPNACSLIRGNRKTAMVSVFSPQGGSGNTTISMGLSLQFARMGLRTFYLNLQTINTMPFFTGVSNVKCGMSNFFFYLKENKKNLGIKIDALKSYDRRLNISYFEPADCALELDELSEFDMGTFLFELKEISQFDVIVVDIDPVLNRRNLVVLNNSDSVLMVVPDDFLAGHKLKLLRNEIRKFLPNDGQELFNKTVTIINQYSKNVLPEEIAMEDMVVTARIPVLADLYHSSTEGVVFNAESGLNVYMQSIAKEIMKNFKLEAVER